MKKAIIKIFLIILFIGGILCLLYGKQFVIYNIGSNNISEVGNKINIPEIGNIKKMSINTLKIFSKGLKNKDMLELYSKSSKEIKNQFTKDEFNKGFKVFIDSNKIYENIGKETVSIIQKPYIKENTNILFVRGKLINEFDFEIQYIYQDSNWKLLSLYIFPKTKYKTNGIKNNTKLNIPDNKKLKKISIETLEKFNIGLKKKSFDELFNDLSSDFKEQISLEKINSAFKVFLNKKIIFKNISEEKIYFEEEPFLDDYNLLVISGYFIEENGKVTFRLKYILEDKKWKLFNIKISPLF